ncbi:hypothetical protein [Halobaculum sp. MBLA0143]|uniref:hypothetical protein n=1 Tax=Halobaculum sp. MBLA0143 TaxID=3079933 RepID=UPI003523C65D
MSDNTDHDRRTVLQSLTAAAVAGIGSTSTVAAADDESGSRPDRAIPFDMKVENRAQTGHTPIVRIVPVTETPGSGFEKADPPVYGRSFSLPALGSGGTATPRVTEKSLNLRGNKRYEVQLTSEEHDEVETMVFGVPPGGVPGYEALFLDISPSGRLRVTMAKE